LVGAQCGHNQRERFFDPSGSRACYQVLGIILSAVNFNSSYLNNPEMTLVCLWQAPGVLHHIIIRGIERRNIIRNNNDREDLIERPSNLLPEKTFCYACPVE